MSVGHLARSSQECQPVSPLLASLGGFVSMFGKSWFAGDLDYFWFYIHFRDMNRSSPCKDLSVFGEYRGIAEALFPSGGSQTGQMPDLAAIADFAEALGIGAEYKRLLGVKKNANDMKVFLGHFQNNLDLLIQKTWVDKSDESRKEKLQDDIPPFIALIMDEKFGQAIEQFGAILEELAYLFFGTQSAKEDFTEYALRIDMQMGLFWWYGSRLGSLKNVNKHTASHIKYLWALLLIGICYLTNF